jgi:hypothetical protein
MGVRLFVGGHAGTVQGEREDLAGPRCFSAGVSQMPGCLKAGAEVEALGDSGAFTDVCDDKRLPPAEALGRQFAWERRASEVVGSDWRFRHLASYDRLIDEKYRGGARRKERWTVAAAELAVRETVEAARFLAGERERVAPRTLVLACQGVDAAQYEDCVNEVLKVARPGDWIGLGGWCILGRFTSWLPVFWETLRRILPLVASAGVTSPSASTASESGGRRSSTPRAATATAARTTSSTTGTTGRACRPGTTPTACCAVALL